MNDLYNYLSQFVSDRRKNIISENVENRTRYLTVVLEDIYQPHNASAVLRTCDCFGIQDVHVIENKNLYDVNPDVALGSDKWINLVKHEGKENNTAETIRELKENGYRVVATTPHHDDVSLDDFDLAKGRVALMFGTEMDGLSEQAIEQADEYLKIPMLGFTESFNISVSAAIILHHLTWKLRSGENINWQLADHEKQEIRLDWMKKSIKNSDLLVKKYLETR